MPSQRIPWLWVGVACGLLILSQRQYVLASAGDGRDRAHGIKPAPKLSDQVKAALESQGLPTFVADDQSPTVEEIRSLKHPAPDGFPTVRIRPSDLQQLTAILDVIKEPSHFVFAGNGYYLDYLMAKGLFRGTPMEERVLFLPASTHRRQFTGQRRAMLISRHIDAFYSFLQLERRDGNIVVIDSISTPPDSSDPNHRSVKQIGQAIRQYLVDAGETVEHAHHRVIPLGIPEHPHAASPGATHSLDAYRAAVAAISPEQLRDPTPQHPLPHLAHPIPWKGLASHVYAGMGPQGPTYWSGKYLAADERGFPVPDPEQERTAQMCRRNPINDTPSLRHETSLGKIALRLERRRGKVACYQQILAAAERVRDWKPELGAKVAEIVAVHAAAGKPAVNDRIPRRVITPQRWYFFPNKAR